MNAHYPESYFIPALVQAGGSIHLPGSKSISNRALLLAALCDGITTVHDVLHSEDTQVMLGAIKTLGCKVEPLDAEEKNLCIHGIGGKFLNDTAEIWLANAGTAMRSIVATLAIVGGKRFVVSGSPRMHERPIRDLVDALRTMGCHIDYLGKDGFPPLAIRAPTLNLNEAIKVRGDVSSQYLTGLLLSLPVVASEQDIVIEVTTELISKPYIHITLEMLKKFGVVVHNDNWQRFVIPKGSKLTSPKEIWIEADASSASYFVALGAIASPRLDAEAIVIEGLGADSVQGDIRFVEAARMMGADIEMKTNTIRIKRGAWPLKAIDLDCNHIPDAAMTLAVMALFADGPTRLSNIASWRVKETDRLTAMATELRKLGAQVDEGADYLAITPPALNEWKAASIETYDDHRIAMCFSLAAFNPAAKPIQILDPICVTKTFPDYFDDFFALVNAPHHTLPTICIDGPTASGKGTLASKIANKLGFHFLDSGALYRASGLAAAQAGIEIDEKNETELVDLVSHISIEFTDDGKTWLNGEDVSEAIRHSSASSNASKISTLQGVRYALMQWQREFKRLPGLVADGRDMGTVIFPEATLKVFLTASPERRAQRRFAQKQAMGASVTIESLIESLRARDLRDSTRSVAPMKPAIDAKLLDNSDQTVDESVAQILQWWREMV